LPRAQKQAHERIIGGRQVDNAEKILSLYEPDIHVLVRGKAGAEVEFGNTVLLGENRQGIILDYPISILRAKINCTCSGRPKSMFSRMTSSKKQRPWTARF
jgi:hypothetical protein